MNPINLWEAITASQQNSRLFDEGRELRALGPRVSGQDIDDLNKSARWNGQELSVTPNEDGWIIKVFSCYTDHSDQSGIEILIPKDSKQPVRVLKDRTGRISYHHD